MSTDVPSYQGQRYPVEIINHCVWLSFRFPLSFGEVEELMVERGVAVSDETIRRWCAKFGQAYASGLRQRRPRPVTNGTATKCSSGSTARGTTCGARSTSTATCSTFWSSPAEIRWPPNDWSARCSKPGVRAAGDRHRQTRRLAARPPRGAGICRASRFEVPQQLDRGLASPHQAAGTGDETVHIARAHAAVLVRVQCDFTAFSAGPAPIDRTRMAYRDG